MKRVFVPFNISIVLYSRAYLIERFYTYPELF